MNKNINKIQTTLWRHQGFKASRSLRIDLFDTIPQVKSRVRYKNEEYEVEYVIYNFDTNSIDIHCNKI